MFLEMVPIERRRHRRMAAMAEQIAHAFRFGNRRLQQRYLPLMTIRILQPSKRGWLRLDKNTAEIVNRHELAQVILSNAIERADLQERHPRIDRHLMRDDISQAAAHEQRRIANQDRWRKAPLI